MLDSPVTSTHSLFEKDTLSALEAISKAQFLAFAPYIFQASVLLRDRGILKAVEASRQEGITQEALEQVVPMSSYGLRILLEAGLGIGLVIRREGRYMLTKLGHFFLNDNMTRVNTDFMRDVCYDGAQDLGTSIDEGRPAGLRHLGENWETIYPYLTQLPGKASESWFAFDHYYSDNAFPEALPVVFSGRPRRILDIGGNTGKFTLCCLQHNTAVELGIVDLAPQLKVARQNVDAAGYTGRVSYHEHNLLDPATRLPEGYDTMWMSQFLDCFADEEIVSILRKCHDALPEGGRVFINETFWDRQRFTASALSLQMTSLYFTTMANGNSQMYDSAVFLKLVEKAGFRIRHSYDNVGLSHTILELEKQ